MYRNARRKILTHVFCMFVLIPILDSRKVTMIIIE